MLKINVATVTYIVRFLSGALWNNRHFTVMGLRNIMYILMIKSNYWKNYFLACWIHTADWMKKSFLGGREVDHTDERKRGGLSKNLLEKIFSFCRLCPCNMPRSTSPDNNCNYRNFQNALTILIFSKISFACYFNFLTE